MLIDLVDEKSFEVFTQAKIRPKYYALYAVSY